MLAEKTYRLMWMISKLHKLAFAVKISLAKARKDDSEIRIKSKEELLHTLTDSKTFGKILDQGTEAHEVSGYIKNYLKENRISILNYFTKIKDKVNADELKFYQIGFYPDKFKNLALQE